MNPTFEELIPPQVSGPCPLGTVTRNCVVIRDPEQRLHTIIVLSRISKVKRIRASYPVLLVIASALLLISAAAFCSQDDHGASLTIFFLGAAAVTGYWLSRTAAVVFVAGSQAVTTAKGSLGEASSLIKEVESALSRSGEFNWVSNR